MASISICFSKSICRQLSQLIATLSWKETEYRLFKNDDLDVSANHKTRILSAFQYSLAIKIESITLRTNFEDDAGETSVICFVLNNITTWLVFYLSHIPSW